MAEPTTLETPATEKSSRFRRVALTVFRVVVVVGIAAAIVRATVDLWPDVRGTLLGLAWQSVLVSLVLALLGITANTLAWRSVLTELDCPLPVATASRIFLVGQLAKYLPGSVWSFVLQMELGRRAGLPRARAFIAGLVATGLGVTAGLALGVLGLPALIEAGGAAVIIVAVLAPVAALCAHPKVLSRLVELFLKVLRRQPLGHSFSWRGVLQALGWSALAWLCFGTHLWLLANAEAAPGFDGLLRSIGAFALAMTAGLFAVVAPSGIGVREAILVAALAPYVGPGAALGIALASRLIFTVADVVAAGGAAASAMRTLRRTAQAAG